MASEPVDCCNEAAALTRRSASCDVRGRLSCVLPGVGPDGLAELLGSPSRGATSAMVAGRFKATVRGAAAATEGATTGGRATTGGGTTIDEGAATDEGTATGEAAPVGEAAEIGWGAVIGRDATTGAGAAAD